MQRVIAEQVKGILTFPGFSDVASESYWREAVEAGNQVG